MKIIFILDTTCEREIVFQKKKIWKQQIKNKPYFYLGFPLTKNSFPLTSFFWCYQTLENVKNYLYRRFSDETNRAGVVIEDIHCQAVVFQSSVFNHASRSCNCVADAIVKKLEATGALRCGSITHLRILPYVIWCSLSSCFSLIIAQSPCLVSQKKKNLGKEAYILEVLHFF